MPWKVVKRGAGKKPWVVVNSETGKVKGRHPTKTKARAQQKALYKNVPESRRKKRGR